MNERQGHKTVVALTRAGSVLAYRTDAPACSPSSWPRFHHDPANSGDARRDAIAPGRPRRLGRHGRRRLVFRSPGDDVLCGEPAAFQLVGVARRGRRPRFGSRAARRLKAPNGLKPGEPVSLPLRRIRKRFVAVRALDEQGNAGRFALLRLRASRN